MTPILGFMWSFRYVTPSYEELFCHVPYGLEGSRLQGSRLTWKRVEVKVWRVCIYIYTHMYEYVCLQILMYLYMYTYV